MIKSVKENTSFEIVFSLIYLVYRGRFIDVRYKKYEAFFTFIQS